TVVLALASGVYNAIRLHDEAQPTLNVEASLPPNTLGSVDHRSGVIFFRPIDPAKFDAAALAQLRSKYEAQGKVVREMGNGQYLVGTAELLKNLPTTPKR